MNATANPKPTSTRFRTPLLLLSVTVLVFFEASSYFSKLPRCFANAYNSDGQIGSGESNPQQPLPWSSADLLAHNVASMFALAPESWPSASNNAEQQPGCPFNLSFYVYDNLPTNLTTDLEDTIRLQAHKGESIQENLGTEWAMVQLFRTSPCRTYNASVADFFVVPYMHYAHCLIHDGYWMACGHIQPAEFDPLFENLQYYKEKPDRHIFLEAHTNPMMNKRATRGSHLKLMADKAMMSSNDKSSAIVVPILHDAPNFQPSQLVSKSESYWTRPRKYAFASFYGATNTNMAKKNNHRRFRQFFLDSVKEYNNETIAGLPYVAVQLTDRKTKLNPMETYQESALCPILPGDCCWARRFFDVIRNGCLPVVLEWKMPNGEGRSWHTPTNHCPIEDSYPFFPQNITKGQVGSVGNLEIDYDAFVVKAPGNPDNETDVSSIYRAMEEILEDPEELAKRQRTMMSYAPLFTFGLGMDGHQHKDAFWMILQVLGQKLQE